MQAGVSWDETFPERARVAPSFDWRPLRYTGEISYGLYLWNPVFLFNYPGSAFNPMLATVLTFAVAAVSFRWLERPALRYKGRFAPVPHQADVVVEPATPEPRAATCRSAPSSEASSRRL